MSEHTLQVTIDDGQPRRLTVPAKRLLLHLLRDDDDLGLSGTKEGCPMPARGSRPTAPFAWCRPTRRHSRRGSSMQLPITSERVLAALALGT